ncbi:MAG TPA: SRPBCC domain-containing protein [Gaiellaceae bacterium]|jgi:uncharacterized protein YndB with AHSA1/START domain|nr:SRPBCC domain-containing protein [Gaiellaceae bacterium]
MTDAMLVTDRTRPAVRLERHLIDPPEVVWRALTDRAQLRSWFPCDVVVDGDWEVGAAITFPFDPAQIDLTLTGEVLEVAEPSVLSYTWGESVLRFELEPDGDGTRLVLTDELPGAWAARNAAGWEQCLDRLEGKEPTEWRRRFEHYSSEFEPTLGEQEGPPSAS